MVFGHLLKLFLELLQVNNMKILSDEQIQELESINKDLDGVITYHTTLNQSGRQSKKIVIEYGVTQKITGDVDDT